MDTIFMNSKNSNSSDPHRLILNLSDQIDLRSSDMKYWPYQIYIEIYKKFHTEKRNFMWRDKFELPDE